MIKPYTWKEVKTFLTKELQKTKHILTFGTFGSNNIEHDIDLLITKKPTSPTSDFYKEIHGIFDSLNAYLNNKYGAKAIRFSTSEEQYLILNLSESSEKDIAFHSHIYTSYPQIQKDWGWAIFEDVDLDKFFKEKYKCIIGSTEDLFSKQFMQKSYYDSIYNFLYRYDKINSHYPKDLFLKVMNHFFDYLYRKRLGLKSPVAKNEKEVREYFYQL